ncbi:MAG: tetratricopeptide repeat protein [Planctomycetota bacterium]
MKIAHYDVHDLLARGGMGVVYRAVDTRSGARVVVKLLKADGEGARRRLLREAEALRRLVHPSVLTLFDVGEHEGQPYLVLPYVSGESLQDRLDRGGALPLAEALDVAVQVGEGLAAAHALGLLHRDVKPANVLVDRRLHGQVKLADFGLVKDTSGEGEELRLSVSGTFMGTLGYAPPEQVVGRLKDVGPPADVYGLGALLYALLSGRAPRSGESLIEVMRAYEEPLAPLPESAPAWLGELLARCLAAEPGARPALPEVLAALRAGAGPARSPRPRAQRGRGPLLLALAVAGAVVAVGASLRYAWQLTAAQPAPAGGLATAEPPPARTEDGPRQEDAPAASPDPRALGEEGSALIDQGRYTAALEVLERAVELDPRDAVARANLGVARMHHRDFEGGLRELQRSLELEPRRAKVYVWLGACLSALRRGREAMEALNRGVELAPDSAFAYSERGAVLSNLGRPREALADLDRALELDPALLQARVNRGLVRARLGDLEPAIRDFTRALALDPTLAPAYTERGMCLKNLDRLEEALVDFDRALELDPSLGRATLNRGLVHGRLGHHDAALADFTRAIELEPEAAHAYYQRGLALHRQGRHRDALADLDRAVALYPTRARSHFSRGVVQAALGEHEAAIRDFTRAIELDPELARAYAQRARSHHLLGHDEEAEADLERSRALQPRRPAGD